MLLLHFLICAIWFSAIDIKTLKIRKSHLLIAILTLIPAINWNQLRFATVNLCLYLLIYTLSQGAIGFGDVRLSFLIGLYIGAKGSVFSALLMANFLGWACAALQILLQRKAMPLHAGVRVAFAPHLFLGVGIWGTIY